MFIIELIGAGYLLSGFGAFLRGNFHRQVALKRTTADPIDADIRVHKELWEVRQTFESLFKDSRARENALKLFPKLNNLTESPTGKAADVPGYTRIVIDSVLWPVMLPINATGKAATNVVEAELKDMQGKFDSFQILADHEDDPGLRSAYRSGDEKRIQQALIDYATREDEKALAIANHVDEPGAVDYFDKTMMVSK